MVWAADDQQCVLHRAGPAATANRTGIPAHTLGTDSALDMLVYDEKDKTLFTWIGRSASREFLLIFITGFTTTETLVVPSYRTRQRAESRAAAATRAFAASRSSERAMDRSYERQGT